VFIGASPALTNPEIRKLKAAAQRLEPVAPVGKGGLTEAVLQSVEEWIGIIGSKIAIPRQKPGNMRLATLHLSLRGSTVMF
jgi:hypothetical protein